MKQGTAWLALSPTFLLLRLILVGHNGHQNLQGMGRDSLEAPHWSGPIKGTFANLLH